jgi:hypothetical protein
MLATDAEEYGLLNIRRIDLTGAGADAPPAAGA